MTIGTLATLLALSGCRFDSSGLSAPSGDAPFDLAFLDAGPFSDAPGRDGAALDGPRPDGPRADQAQPSDGPPISDAPRPPDLIWPDGPCTPIELVSSKSYKPNKHTSGTRNFAPTTVTFLLPATLGVTKGSGGNHCSYLTHELNATSTICAYKGGASVAHVGTDPKQIKLGQTYHFVECRRPAGKKLSFPACSGKADGSVTVTKAWTAITATKVTLVVHGDSDLSPTEVRLTLPGACAP